MSLQYQYWLFTANSLANVITALALLAILWLALRVRRAHNRMVAQDEEYQAETEERLRRDLERQIELIKKERRESRLHEVPPSATFQDMIPGYTEQQLREMPFEEFEAIKRSGHLEDQLRRAARREQQWGEPVTPADREQENG